MIKLMQQNSEALPFGTMFTSLYNIKFIFVRLWNSAVEHVARA